MFQPFTRVNASKSETIQFRPLCHHKSTSGCHTEVGNPDRLGVFNCLTVARIMARIWRDCGEHMTRKYIHELVGWPEFTWDSKALAPLVSEVRLHQGLLLGKMRGYGFASQWTATLKVLTEETIKSSAIEGVVLDPESVHSSLARRLGLEVGGLKAHKDRYVDGVVEMMLDATQKFKEPLSKEHLFDWHADLFPEVRRTGDKFRIGAWRDD